MFEGRLILQIKTKLENLDGRRIRRQHNRRRIVEAILDLIRAGAISPSAEEVAVRAAVGLRTVFRHFDDMDSLYREIAEVMEAEISPILAAPFASEDWGNQLLEMIGRRSRVFEKLMPFKIAADVHRHRSAFLRQDHANLTDFQRASLRSVVPPEIRSDRIRFEALDVLLSFETWQRLRQEQGLSVAKAKKTVELAIGALIAGQKT